MQYIQLPDGTTAEFPDDISDEEIKAVLQREYPSDIEPTQRIPVAETPEAQALNRMVEPEEEGYWEGWIKPSLEEIGRAGIVAPAETAMALAGPVLTWPAGKLKGIATIIGSLFSGGDPEKGAEMARAAEEDVMSLGYQPYTPEAQKAVELVGKAFHYGLWPARKAGEELTKMGYPRLAYLLETTGELAMFEVAHGVRAKVKARAAAKKAPVLRPEEFERFMTEERAKQLEQEFAEIKPRPREELPAKFIEELRKVEPVEVAPYELASEVKVEKPWQAVKPRERPEVLYKRRGRITKEKPEEILRAKLEEKPPVKGKVEEVKPIVAPQAKEGKAGNVLIKTKDGIIYESEKTHPLMINEFDRIKPIEIDGIDSLGVRVQGGRIVWRNVNLEALKAQLRNIRRGEPEVALEVVKVEKVVPKVEPKVKGKTYQMFETGGLQYGYEALKSIREGRTEKVRQATEQARKEFLTPVEGNPLDKGAIAFLKSEKFGDYVRQMPNIGELKPSEIFKYDPTAKKLIATIETKEGKLKPAIRQSGYHALKDFSDAFTGVKDVSKLSATWTDPTRFIQELDQGRWGGMAQKHILWPMRSTTLAKLRWSDMRKGSLANIQEKYNAKSGKKADAIGDVIEYISTERLRVPSEQFLQIPEVAKLLKGFKPEVKIELIGAAKEIRTFFNDLLKAQNLARKSRKQKLIDYRQVYRPWIMQQNIWHKLLGLKQKPETIMERPEMPDFIFPDKPPNPRALAREGGLAGYPKIRNIFKLAADYIDTAGRDIFDTNIVHQNKIHSAVLRGKGLENAAEGINRLTAEVYAGVAPRITRAAVETLPKPIHKGMLKIRRMLTRAVFPLNWTWNLFIQTSSAGITYARYGNRANLAGLRYFVDPKTKNAVQTTAYSYILKSRWGGKAHYQDIQNSITRNKRLEAKPIEKVEDLFNYLTSTFESGLTGHAITAARYHGRTKLGLKGRELWEYASEGGAKTQSMYNYGDLPGLLRAKEVGAVAPFQTFSFEVFNTVREMNIPVLRKVIGKTGLYETMSANSVAGKALMSNRMKMLARWMVAIAITDVVGEKAIGRKPWVVSSFIPFVGYLVGGYAGRGPVPHQYIQDAKKGIRDVLVNEDFGRLRKWLLRYHVLAGVQINRMLDGIEVVAKRGRVEDIRGRLLYKVSPEEYLKGILMGPYRTEAGKEYIRKRRKAKSLLEQLKKKPGTSITID